MTLNEIKNALKRLEQGKKHKLPEVLYWVCQGLSDEDIGLKMDYSASAIYSRKETLKTVLKSLGIETIDVEVRRAIEELAGDPPSFDPWPPIEPEPIIEEVEDDNDDEIVVVEGVTENIETETDANPEIDNWTERLRRLVSLIPFEISRQNVLTAIIAVAIFVGAILTFTFRPWGEDEPNEDVPAITFLGEPDVTATRVSQQTAVSAVLTEQAPTPFTPNPTLTLQAENTRIAQIAAQTATAAVTPTPSTTPTETPTNTPTATPTVTPTPTPTRFRVIGSIGSEVSDDRVRLVLTDHDYWHQSDVGTLRAFYATGFDFEFTNNTGSDILLGFTVDDFILMDDVGNNYPCLKPIRQKEVSTTISPGETFFFVIGCGKDRRMDVSATTMTLAIHNFSSLPDMDWVFEIPR